MAKFLITYDLNIPGQNYDSLFKAIESLGETRHGMQNAWFLKSNSTSSEIRDYLRKFIDSNDRLFVCETTGWASYNLEIASWFKN